MDELAFLHEEREDRLCHLFLVLYKQPGGTLAQSIENETKLSLVYVPLTASARATLMMYWTAGSSQHGDQASGMPVGTNDDYSLGGAGLSGVGQSQSQGPNAPQSRRSVSISYKEGGIKGTRREGSVGSQAAARAVSSSPANADHAQPLLPRLLRRIPIHLNLLLPPQLHGLAPQHPFPTRGCRAPMAR